MAQTRESENSAYTVGWGKPPKHTQFKKGQSGNPAGRPKGKNNSLSKVLTKELNLMVNLANGEHISKKQVIVRQLINKAATGDIRSQKLILAHQQKAERKEKAEMLMDKLIKDNYVTDKTIDNYLDRGKIIEPESTCSMISCCFDLATMNKQLTAQLSLLYALMLSEILVQVMYVLILAEKEKSHSSCVLEVAVWGLLKSFRRQFDLLKHQPGYLEEETKFEKKGKYGVFLERKRENLSSEEFKEEKEQLKMFALSYEVAKQLPTVKECQRNIKVLMGDEKSEIKECMKCFSKKRH